MRDNGSLGCAYYVASDEVLYLLEDVAMAGIDLVDTLLLHGNPTTVIISARAPETLADYLAQRAQGVAEDSGKGRISFFGQSKPAADQFLRSFARCLYLTLNQLRRVSVRGS